MARQSTITKLAPALRAECDRLIREGGYTVDDLLAHLQQLGAPIKRTALAEYKKRTEMNFAKYREAQEVAGQWVKDLGDSPDSKTGQLLAQLLQTVAFRSLVDLQAQEEGSEAKDIAMLARALKDISGAQKTDFEHRLKLRAQWKAELAERAAETATAVEKSAKSNGLSDVDAARLREMVLGVVS
jgi:hypothetical protein